MFLCGVHSLYIFFVSDESRFLLFIKIACNFIIYKLIQEVTPTSAELKVYFN